MQFGHRAGAQHPLEEAEANKTDRTIERGLEEILRVVIVMYCCRSLSIGQEGRCSPTKDGIIEIICAQTRCYQCNRARGRDGTRRHIKHSVHYFLKKQTTKKHYEPPQA